MMTVTGGLWNFKPISLQVRADPLRPTQRKHKAYDAHLHPLRDCVNDHCTAQHLSTGTSSSQPWGLIKQPCSRHLPLDTGRLWQRSTYCGMTVLSKCPAGTKNASDLCRYSNSSLMSLQTAFIGKELSGSRPRLEVLCKG